MKKIKEEKIECLFTNPAWGNQFSLCFGVGNQSPAFHVISTVGGGHSGGGRGTTSAPPTPGGAQGTWWSDPPTTPMLYTRPSYTSGFPWALGSHPLYSMIILECFHHRGNS